MDQLALDLREQWHPGMPERRRMPRDPSSGTRPVDLAYLGRFTFGNRELEREVLYLFAQQVPAYLKALEEAVDQKSWHAAAHTLKGSARAVGAWRVARGAEAAERLPFDVGADRRRHAIDFAAEAADEAIAHIVQIYPET